MARWPGSGRLPGGDVSRPTRCCGPTPGSRQDLADHLAAVADDFPWLRDRPLTVVRAPDGVEGQRFYQKAAPKHAPSWIATVGYAPSAGRDIDYVLSGAPTLQWLATRPSSSSTRRRCAATRPPRPARRGPRPARRRVRAAVEVAFLVLEVLDDLEHAHRDPETGGKGLHLVARSNDEGTRRRRAAATRLTEIVADRRADLVTDRSEAGRKGRVLDPSATAVEATIVAPYSPAAGRCDRLVPVSRSTKPHRCGRPATQCAARDLLDRPIRAVARLATAARCWLLPAPATPGLAVCFLQSIQVAVRIPDALIDPPGRRRGLRAVRDRADASAYGALGPAGDRAPRRGRPGGSWRATSGCPRRTRTWRPPGGGHLGRGTGLVTIEQGEMKWGRRRPRRPGPTSSSPRTRRSRCSAPCSSRVSRTIRRIHTENPRSGSRRGSPSRRSPRWTASSRSRSRCSYAMGAPRAGAAPQLDAFAAAIDR